MTSGRLGRTVPKGATNINRPFSLDSDRDRERDRDRDGVEDINTIIAGMYWYNSFPFSFFFDVRNIFDCILLDGNVSDITVTDNWSAPTLPSPHHTKHTKHELNTLNDFAFIYPHSPTLTLFPSLTHTYSHSSSHTLSLPLPLLLPLPDILKAPGADLLSEKELQLCGAVPMLPMHYLTAKDAVVR